MFECVASTTKKLSPPGLAVGVAQFRSVCRRNDLRRRSDVQGRSAEKALLKINRLNQNIWAEVKLRPNAGVGVVGDAASASSSGRSTSGAVRERADLDNILTTLVERRSRGVRREHHQRAQEAWSNAVQYRGFIPINASSDHI
jgi:hypothetical protein